MAKVTKKPAPKKKQKAVPAKAAPKKKVAAKKLAAAKLAATKPAPVKPVAARKKKFEEPASPAEALRMLALAYAEARATLSPEATDRQKAVYAVAMTGPAREPDVGAAERASGITFSADYRALLAAHDGARFAADLAVLGTSDWISSSELIRKGRSFVTDSVSYGATELTGAVPIANLGQPNDWLLYDPAAQKYLYCLNADFVDVADLRSALSRKVRISIEVLRSEA